MGVNLLLEYCFYINTSKFAFEYNYSLRLSENNYNKKKAINRSVKHSTEENFLKAPREKNQYNVFRKNLDFPQKEAVAILL